MPPYVQPVAAFGLRRAPMLQSMIRPL